MKKTATLALGCLTFFGGNAFAQTEVPSGISAPTYNLTDPNGVNLTSNKPTYKINDLSIGSSDHALRHSVSTIYEQQTQPSVSFVDSFSGKVGLGYGGDPASCQGGTGMVDVTIGGAADRMCAPSQAGPWTPLRGNGSAMVKHGDGTLTYTTSDGTRYFFGIIVATNSGYLTQITSPDGRITTLTYKSGMVGATTYRRVQSVTRNDGLQLKYTYTTDTLPGSGHPTTWLQIASVRAINNAVDYCDPQADSCTYSQTWHAATQVWTTSGSIKYLTLTDAGGQATRFTVGRPVLTPGQYGPQGPTNFTADQLLAVRAPTSTSADTVVYTFCAVQGEYSCMKEGVKKVQTNGLDWLYPATSGIGGPSIFMQTTASRPASIGGSRVLNQQRGNLAGGALIYFLDNIGKKTYTWEGSLANRLQRVDSADGHRLSFVHDARGNITQETHTPTAGSSLQPTIRNANYDTTCANPVTCNRPNWVTDARGYQTDFTYDPVHGGLLTATSPADQAGIRAQTRYTYAQRYAWFKNSAGTVAQAASPIWVITHKKYCRSSATLADGTGCSVAGDEVVTTFDYGPTTGANNLFPRGFAVTANGVTQRTCYANDSYGNQVGETFPKAGLTSCP